MKPIVECVPNFSEGRRQDVVEGLAAAIQAVTGVRVLSVETDADHNRAVITFAGAPQDVEEAAFRAIAQAANTIDMTEQRGGHPRMGAADVVPFVPIRGVTMEECVEMARRLGKRVGDELDIPVYLYEEAASRPDRRNLADIRRGEYEGIAREIAVEEGRIPDFGPRKLGKAGAVAIGARPPLIAFNAYLNTDDVRVAKDVARALRNSSGGLRFVKALGLLVDGRAQVSMNLTDYRQTPMLRVLDMIRCEAGRWGTSVVETEVVGLLPADALIDAALAALQLHGFTPEQILENMLSDM